MKTKSTVALSAITLALVAGAAYISQRGGVQARQSGVTGTTNPIPSSPSWISKSEAKPRESQAQVIPYADALKGSHNYLDFAKSTIRDAESGNRDAQYYLGKALGFCDGTYHMYFERKGQVLTLDEALMWAARLHRSAAFVQTVYDRCHDLKDHYAEAFRKSSDWIGEAANAGQPVALATLAVEKFSDIAIHNSSARAGQPPAAGDPMADARANLRAAVESKDAEALWQIGLAQGFLTQDFGEKVKNEMAWWLVSCQRGYDCSPQADWLTLDCPDESFCTPGISGIDYIRNGSGADWPEVQLRAQDINAKLDAGKWRELGLDK
ncbi:MAG TPA: hypothetical protein VNH39_00145 [Steroidobacteraceae bacterium]|nr:hypothetical protein [Steroidobacteraceae bacterium]